MNDFKLLASPIWINFLILVPFLLFYYWRKKKLEIPNYILIFTAIFGIAFGFVEAAVVIYLRASIGFLPGFKGTLADIQRLASSFYSQPIAAQSMPQSLLIIESLREFATIVMLFSISSVSTKNFKERFAMFLYAFSFWDIFYYVFLFLLVRWPSSLTTPDVLFLIPTPWISQVWFSIVVSLLSIFTVIISRKKF